MKKDEIIIPTVLSAILLATVLTTSVLLVANGYVTHGPDIDQQ